MKNFIKRNLFKMKIISITAVTAGGKTTIVNEIKKIILSV